MMVSLTLVFFRRANLRAVSGTKVSERRCSFIVKIHVKRWYAKKSEILLFRLACECIWWPERNESTCSEEPFAWHVHIGEDVSWTKSLEEVGVIWYPVNTQELGEVPLSRVSTFILYHWIKVTSGTVTLVSLRFLDFIGSPKLRYATLLEIKGFGFQLSQTYRYRRFIFFIFTLL